MNITTIIGIVSGNIVFFATVILSLGGLNGFFDANSALIVIGGSISAIIACLPPRHLKGILSALKQKILFSPKKTDYPKLIEEIVALAVGRKKGDAAFDSALNSITNPFLKDAGSVLFWTKAEVSMEEFRDLLETRAVTYYEYTQAQSNSFKILAKFPPAFGMMGTVLGLIALLASLGGADAKDKIGPAMAVALVTTLYGIAINNLLVVPCQENLAATGEEELRSYRICIEGIILIQQKKPTKYIEEKVRSFLLPSERGDDKK